MTHDTGRIRYVVTEARTGRTFYLYGRRDERVARGFDLPPRLAEMLPRAMAYHARVADKSDSVVQVEDGRVTA